MMELGRTQLSLMDWLEPQALVAAVLILASFLLPFLYTYLTSPLKSFPGPPLAKFTNIWRLRNVLTRSAEKTQQQLHEKHGVAVVLGPNMVSINDPELVRVIYSRKELLLKSDFYAVNDLFINKRRVPNVFSTRDEHMNTKIMKPALRLFAMNNVLKYEPLVDKTINYFFECLDQRFVSSGKPCDMDNWLHFCAWDVIAETTFSKPMGFLQQGQDIQSMMAGTYSAMDYFSVIGMMPFLDLFLDKNPVYRLGPPFFGPAITFALEQIDQRRKGLDGHDAQVRPDFLDGFLEAQRTDPDIVTEDILLAYMMVNVSAGSDTVATELRSCIYHLASNQRALKKLQAELDLSDMGRSNTGATVSWAQAQTLSYLDACVREGYRLAPGIALPLERVVGPKGLALPDGRFLPPGTFVGINPWVMNRHKGVFGKDADEFRPERWLQTEEETEEAFRARTALMREVDLTFGYGKRMCAGRPIALLEIYKIVGSFCKTYDFELMANGRPYKTINSWFLRQSGLDLQLKRRVSVSQRTISERSEVKSVPTIRRNFFKVNSIDENYWNIYLAARPKYEKNDFYSLIWNYHTSSRHAQKPGFGLAHDIATGPGQVAFQLRKHFQKVIASDNNATHLEVAAVRERSEPRIGTEGAIVFDQAASEELVRFYSKGETDLVTAVECMPLMNAEQSIDSFAHLLRPGGTLAIWFYGRPAFVKPVHASGQTSDTATVQAKMGEIIDISFKRVISAASTSMQGGFQRSADRMCSWLDDVALPQEDWQNVQRRKWNPNAEMSFIQQASLDLPIQVTSNVGASEKTQEGNDTEFWAEEWSLNEVKQFVKVLLPAFKADDAVFEGTIAKKWEELERLMGGREVKWKMTWPVVLILATRR